MRQTNNIHMNKLKNKFSANLSFENRSSRNPSPFKIETRSGGGKQ